MTPEQSQFLNSLITGLGPEAQKAFGPLLQGFSEENFQKGVVDPTMKTYNQQVLPGIEQRFTDANAGTSSALNQALVSSSEDLANVLGSQRINYQQMANQTSLGALSQILGLLGQRSFEPIVQGPQSGWFNDVVKGAGQAAAGYASGAGMAASSREIKKNIRNFDKGLELLQGLAVKQYDYTIPVTGTPTDRIGLIAEEIPSEIQSDLDGIKAVDLYGLVSILVNCVQQLDKRLSEIEVA
ncbi:Intramolecular chaperone auto-processing domain containing protein [uncultured Caudovirales phage]|uniref:Intramolecular chaperone auto-processing domain containing protein n=1 Tax=uncultured Caudovirales phage TaxID=2100421 RepID=A0A6J5P6M0_9CAUD|nr:Intramolecular chaperone auto-processing domain containing protein [uncultured Caudovirales phage]